MTSKSMILLSQLAVGFLLAGCGSSPGESPDQSSRASEPGTSPGSVETYVDPDTGTAYEVDPQRTVVLGEGSESSTTVNGDLGTVRSAMGTFGTATDWSGQIQVQIVRCSSINPAESVSVSCGVDRSYVMIGGGAQVLYTGAGALLWESRPQDSNNSGTGRFWSASSKSHGESDPHRLAVWSVGIKMKRTDGTWMTHDELKQYVNYHTATSPAVPHPTASCTMGSGWWVVGGGGRSNWQQFQPASGHLLTYSHADTLSGGGTAWSVGAKDHYYGEAASLTAYCVSIQQSIPNVGRVAVSYYGGPTQRVDTGVATSEGLFQGHTVPACYGAYSSYDEGSPGRLVFRMSPGESDIRSYRADTKDHLGVSAGDVNSAGVALSM